MDKDQGADFHKAPTTLRATPTFIGGPLPLYSAMALRYLEICSFHAFPKNALDPQWAFVGRFRGALGVFLARTGVFGSFLGAHGPFGGQTRENVAEWGQYSTISTILHQTSAIPAHVVAFSPENGRNRAFRLKNGPNWLVVRGKSHKLHKHMRKTQMSLFFHRHDKMSYKRDFDRKVRWSRDGRVTVAAVAVVAA